MLIFRSSGVKSDREAFPTLSMSMACPAPVSSRFLMNNIPRGTKVITLLNYLLEPRRGQYGESLGSLLPQTDVDCGGIITDSRLDDELSVAIIEFANTPDWLQYLREDSCGFPKRTPFGTLWEAVDRNAINLDGQTAFMAAVMQGDDLLFPEMLVEFHDTDINIQDRDGMTALHWACTLQHLLMVQLCLSVPDCMIGLRDKLGRTAFDIAAQNDNDAIPTAFYRNIMEMDANDTQNALLRVLTITAELNRDSPIFPGIALFDPVKSGNEPLVIALIERGIDLTVRNDNNDTALHVAAQTANVPIVEALLNAGSDVNARGNCGATPLHYAAITGNVEKVQAMLVAGADVAIEDYDRNLAVDLAEQGRHLEVWHLLKTHRTALISKNESSPRMVQRGDGEEMRPARQFVERGQEPTQRTLPISASADVELKPKVSSGEGLHGRPGLGYGPDFGDEVLKTLLQAAVSGGNSGLHALQDLAGSGIRPRKHNPSCALDLAVRCGDLAMVKLLLTAGAVTTQGTRSADSILKLAVDTGEIAMVKLLLDFGADINRSSVQGETVLRNAASCEFGSIIPGGSVDQSNITAIDLGIQMVKLLLKAGANIHAVNLGGETALHKAAQTGVLQVVVLLVENGALVDAIADGGYTPLHHASFMGHASIVDQLLQYGADIEARMGTGFYNRLVDRVRQGADNVLRTRDSGRGLTALHLAVKNDHAEVVKVLLANGAVFNSRSVDGTPQEIADGRNPAIIAMLHMTQRNHERGTG